MNDKKTIRGRVMHIDTCQGKGSISTHVVSIISEYVKSRFQQVIVQR